MADLNEQLGQNVEEAIESREDEISKHGGVTVSLEDFFSRASDANPISEEDEKALRKNLEDEYSFNNTQIDEILETGYDFTQGSIDLNVIPEVDTLITDISLLNSFNTDTTITQTNLFEQDITPIAQENIIEEAAPTETVTTAGTEETVPLTTAAAQTEEDGTVADTTENETPAVNDNNDTTDTDNTATPGGDTSTPSTGGDNNSNVTVTVVSAPTITMESTGDDSVYNNEELGEDGTVTATINLPADTASGDTLTINGVDQTLTDEDIAAGNVTIEVLPGSTVTASITDTAGNTSDDTRVQVAGADTQAEQGTVTVASITEDDVINASETNETITVTGTATGGDISTGDTVTATINGNEYSAEVHKEKKQTRTNTKHRKPKGQATKGKER